MRGDAGVIARSGAGKDALGANRAWEVDREVLLIRSERRAWLVSCVALAVSGLAIAADFSRGALRQIVPIPLVVDRATGETTVQMPLTQASVPVEDALDKHFAVQFVSAREGYDWNWLNRDYNTVARLADPEVFAPYAALFSGQKGQNITDRLADRTQWRVAILNVRFPPMAPSLTASGTRVREAFVTFERQAWDVHERAGVAPAQRFVASLRFEYRPKIAMTDAERIENPLGFLVTAYRTDAEFTPAGRDAASSTVSSTVSPTVASNAASAH